MRVITLWQPWAHYVASGAKRIENRPWEPSSRLLGQRIAIHAGKHWDQYGATVIEDVLGQCVSRADVTFGAVIATAILGPVVTTEEAAERLAGEGQGMWFSGPYGWVLEHIEKMESPILCRGYQGLWSIDLTAVQE